jgi:predicted DNA-binding antitoxin AbrB/MazE fold protein
MVRAKGRYRNQVLELEQPLALPEGTRVEVDVYVTDESQQSDAHDSEEHSWALLGTARLEDEWDNPGDAIYDDWKRLYGV